MGACKAEGGGQEEQADEEVLMVLNVRRSKSGRGEGREERAGRRKVVRG